MAKSDKTQGFNLGMSNAELRAIYVLHVEAATDEASLAKAKAELAAFDKELEDFYAADAKRKKAQRSEAGAYKQMLAEQRKEAEAAGDQEKLLYIAEKERAAGIKAAGTEVVRGKRVAKKTPEEIAIEQAEKLGISEESALALGGIRETAKAVRTRKGAMGDVALVAGQTTPIYKELESSTAAVAKAQENLADHSDAASAELRKQATHLDSVLRKYGVMSTEAKKATDSLVGLGQGSNAVVTSTTATGAAIDRLTSYGKRLQKTFGDTNPELANVNNRLTELGAKTITASTATISGDKALRQQIAGLKDLISHYGVASKQVADYAAQITTGSLVTGGFVDKTSAQNAVLSTLRTHTNSLRRSLGEDNDEVKAAADLMGRLGQATDGSSNKQQTATRVLNQWTGQLRDNIKQHGVLSPKVKEYAQGMLLQSQATGSVVSQEQARLAIIKVLNQEQSRMASTVGKSHQDYKQLSGVIKEFGANSDEAAKRHARLNTQVAGFSRGALAGVFGFTLLATLPVVAGRAITGFATSAVRDFRAVEAEAANLSQVQINVSIETLEASLNKIRKDIPATVQEISAAFYEVSSLGGKNINVSQKVTEQLTLGAKTARADIKTWVDDVLGSLNQWGLGLDRVQEVQAKFFQAAADSVATPAQLAQAWGPVALAVQQAGGSIEDALGMLVAASRGVGDFQENATTVQRLVNSISTDQGRAQLEKFGIQMQTVDGQAVPLIQIITQLRDKLRGLTQGEQTLILNQLVPEARSTRGIQTLLTHLDDWVAEYDKLGNAQGTFSRSMDSYLDTNQAKLQTVENQFASFKETLGKKIDPIRLVFNIIQSIQTNFPESKSYTTGEGLPFTITPQQPVVTPEVSKAQRQAENEQAARQHRIDFGQFLSIFDPNRAKTQFEESKKYAQLTADQLTQVLKHSASERAEAEAQAAKSSEAKWAASFDGIKHHALGMAGDVGDAVMGMGLTFRQSLEGAIGGEMVDALFKGLPADLKTKFASLMVELNPNLDPVLDEYQRFAGRLQAIMNQLHAPGLDPKDVERLRNEFGTVLKQFQDWWAQNSTLLQPDKSRDLQNQLSKWINQEEAIKRVTAAQEELNNVTAFYNQMIATRTEELSGIQGDFSSIKSLVSELKQSGQVALEGALGSPETFTQWKDRALKEISEWRQGALDEIASWKEQTLTTIKGEDIPEAMKAQQRTLLEEAANSRIALVNEAAKTVTDTVNKFQGLAAIAAEFTKVIDDIQGQINRLNLSIAYSTEELTRRQRMTKDELANSLAIGAQGPLPNEEKYRPSRESLVGTGQPAFLSVKPGFLKGIAGEGADLTNQIIALKKQIETPIAGQGFIVPFEQQVADLQAELAALQMAADQTRRAFAAREFEMGSQQYELTQRRNAATRPLNDRSWEISNALYEQQLRQTMALRPLDDALWELNRQYQLEQDNMTRIERKYRDELQPLQMEQNKLAIEANEIAHEKQRLQDRDTVANQINQLSRLTPGTAAYVSVQRQMVQARKETDLAEKQWLLSDKIARINLQRDAEVNSEQRKLDALQDTITARQRERDLIAHNAELANRALQDELNDINHRTDVLNHNFDLEQRQIDDRMAQLAEERRQFEYNEGLKEQAMKDRITIAQIELQWAQKVSGEWQTVQSVLIRNSQDAVTTLGTQLNDVQFQFDIWRKEKFDPALLAMNTAWSNLDLTIKQLYNDQIKLLNGEGGIINTLKDTATEAEKAASRRVKSEQDYQKELERTYTLLDLISQFIKAGLNFPAEYIPPKYPKGYIPVDQWAGEKKWPQPVENPPKKATGGWAYPPGHAEWVAENEPEFIVPRHQMSLYSQAMRGGSYTVHSGDIIIQGVGGINTQADADRVARMIKRGMERDSGMQGTGYYYSQGYN